MLLAVFKLRVSLSKSLARGSLKSMNIALPEPLEARLTPEMAALHLAIGLFVAEEVTLGDASRIAGLSQGQFLRELGRRRIPQHYGLDEFAQDLATIATLPVR